MYGDWKMSRRVKLLHEGESVQVSGTVEKNRNENLSKGVKKIGLILRKRAAQGKFHNASPH